MNLHDILTGVRPTECAYCLPGCLPLLHVLVCSWNVACQSQQYSLFDLKACTLHPNMGACNSGSDSEDVSDRSEVRSIASVSRGGHVVNTSAWGAFLCRNAVLQTTCTHAPRTVGAFDSLKIIQHMFLWCERRRGIMSAQMRLKVQQAYSTCTRVHSLKSDVSYRTSIIASQSYGYLG